MTSPPANRFRLLPRLKDIVFLAVFAGALVQGGRMMNVDGDLGRHLTIGMEILDTWQIPTVDIFSHTLPGAELVPHEWLAEVFFAGAYKLLGFNGVILLSALLLAGTFYLTCRQAERRSQLTLVPAVLAVLAVAATSFHWLARPHLFSYLLAVQWMGLLERAGHKRSRAWIFLPSAMLAWANLHGGFVIGFFLWGIFTGGSLAAALLKREKSALNDLNWQGLLAGGLASLMASMVNPAGWRTWSTSLGYLQNRYLTSHTWEYQPPNFSMPAFWPFALLLAACLVLIISQRGRLKFREALLMAGLAVAGLCSARAVPFFAILSVPLLSAWVGTVVLRPPRLPALARIEDQIQHTERQYGGQIWPALVVLAGVIWAGILPASGGAGPRYGFSQEQFPVGAQAWIDRSQPQGNMFNYFTWGGYLLFENWPERKVFIDGQTDFYGEDLTRQYEITIGAAPGWREVLDEYDISWVILPPDAPLVVALQNEPGWQSMYNDQTAVILAYDP